MSDRHYSESSGPDTGTTFPYAYPGNRNAISPTSPSTPADVNPNWIRSSHSIGQFNLDNPSKLSDSFIPNRLRPTPFNFDPEYRVVVNQPTTIDPCVLKWVVSFALRFTNTKHIDTARSRRWTPATTIAGPEFHPNATR